MINLYTELNICNTHFIICCFSGLFEHLYEDYMSTRGKNGDKRPLPDIYSPSGVKLRIRNRVKHYLERRKRDLRKREGVPPQVHECYKADSAKFEVGI